MRTERERFHTRVQTVSWLPALLALFLVAPAAAADPPRLSLPIDCVTGENCWLYQYVDVDPGPQAVDYMCGARSYDGHNGTDIALADLEAMQRGVAVLAAADGRVRNVRDGVPDRLLNPGKSGDVEGRECGNGVAIEHGGGWETMYCHLRQGSVGVEPGEVVTRGQPLGLVGLSGNTEFPHLHFTVRHEGEVIDPFLGRSAAEGCGAPLQPLWSAAAEAATRYSPVDIYQIGFASDVPRPQAAYAGELNSSSLPATAPALVAWTTLAGVRAGDRLILRLISPDGDVIAESDTILAKTQIRYFAYTGRRLTASAWPVGDYRAEASLVRDDGGAPLRRAASLIINVR